MDSAPGVRNALCCWSSSPSKRWISSTRVLATRIAIVARSVPRMATWVVTFSWRSRYCPEDVVLGPRLVAGDGDRAGGRPEGHLAARARRGRGPARRVRRRGPGDDQHSGSGRRGVSSAAPARPAGTARRCPATPLAFRLGVAEHFLDRLIGHPRGVGRAAATRARAGVRAVVTAGRLGHPERGLDCRKPIGGRVLVREQRCASRLGAEEIVICSSSARCSASAAAAVRWGIFVRSRSVRRHPRRPHLLSADPCLVRRRGGRGAGRPGMRPAGSPHCADRTAPTARAAPPPRRPRPTRVDLGQPRHSRSSLFLHCRFGARQKIYGG